MQAKKLGFSLHCTFVVENPQISVQNREHLTTSGHYRKHLAPKIQKVSFHFNCILIFARLENTS